MPNLLFLYLKAFSATGGIEKVNRVLLKALYEMQLEGIMHVTAASPYATIANEQYFPSAQLVGYGGSRWRFMFAMLFRSFKIDTLFVAHINLAPAVWLLRWRYPHMKVILMTHGIEVWSNVSGLKKWLLLHADRIISVSHFTKDKLITLQKLKSEKIVVLPNCLDPYFKPPVQLDKPEYLLQRHALNAHQKVLLTITRLNAKEAYKGYDNILLCLPDLLKKWPDLQYILGGKYDEAEKKRIDTIIHQLGIQNNVSIIGFISDEELSDYYRLADLFVMPSKKEGFGLVFIEAMACGTPAIGGNLDGSVEALQPGILGRAVNPDNSLELIIAIQSALNAQQDASELQRKVLERYDHRNYYTQLTLILQEV